MALVKRSCIFSSKNKDCSLDIEGVISKLTITPLFTIPEGTPRFLVSVGDLVLFSDILTTPVITIENLSLIRCRDPILVNFSSRFGNYSVSYDISYSYSDGSSSTEYIYTRKTPSLGLTVDIPYLITPEGRVILKKKSNPVVFSNLPIDGKVYSHTNKELEKNQIEDQLPKVPISHAGILSKHSFNVKGDKFSSAIDILTFNGNSVEMKFNRTFELLSSLSVSDSATISVNGEPFDPSKVYPLNYERVVVTLNYSKKPTGTINFNVGLNLKN